METPRRSSIPSLSNSIGSFGLQTIQTISKDQKSNVVISPYSINEVVALTGLGAVEDTQDQIMKTLMIDPKMANSLGKQYSDMNGLLFRSSEGITLNIANSIWVHNKYKLNPEFASVAKNSFGAEVAPLTSNSANDINQWVSKATNGKISKIIDKIDNAKMILCNAIYFKGLFEHAFDEKETKQDKFQSERGSIDVQMMHQKRKFQYKETDSYQAVQIEYSWKSGQGEQKPQMMSSVFLPKTTSDIDKLIGELASNSKLLFSGFQELEGNLFLPRFKVEFETSLKKHLMTMGMEKPFTDRANFGNLSTPGDLMIDDVIHKAVLEVNEKGAEAAAATVVKMMPRAIMHQPPKTFQMKVNRPFLFVIQEQNTEALLFVGKITNPQ